jgi:hypothetical protein
MREPSLSLLCLFLWPSHTLTQLSGLRQSDDDFLVLSEFLSDFASLITENCVLASHEAGTRGNLPIGRVLATLIHKRQSFI